MLLALPKRSYLHSQGVKHCADGREKDGYWVRQAPYRKGLLTEKLKHEVGHMGE
jgi:hypothetical protein